MLSGDETSSHTGHTGHTTSYHIIPHHTTSYHIFLCFSTNSRLNLGTWLCFKVCLPSNLQSGFHNCACKLGGPTPSSKFLSHVRLSYPFISYFAALCFMATTCNNQELSINIINWLVVWNMFYFPIYWGCHHPN